MLEAALTRPKDLDLAFSSWTFERLAAYVRELREHDRMFSPEIRSSTGYLAFKGGIESYHTRLLWTRQVRKQFEEALS